MLSATGLSSMLKRNQRANHGVSTGVDVGLVIVADVRRRPRRLARDGHVAAHRPGDDVGHLVVAIGSALTER